LSRWRYANITAKKNRGTLFDYDKATGGDG